MEKGMLTPEQEDLLTETYDLLLKLYVYRNEAKDQDDGDRLNALEGEIAKLEAQRISIRQWEQGWAGSA
jgi:hypothetical protein